MSFIEWLDKEIRKKGWTRSRLAIRSGLTPSAIYLVASGERQPGPEMCKGIAKALNVSVEEVLRAAGILSPLSKTEGNFERLKYLIKDLSPEEQDEALDVLEALVRAKARKVKDIDSYNE